MRILLVYPGPVYSTYDVAAGYERGLREAGHEVYPYQHHGWLRFYDVAIGRYREHDPERALPLDAPHVIAAEHVAIEAVDVVPDVVLTVSMGLHRRGYDLLARLGLPVALLLTESPYEDGLQAMALAKGHVDLAFTNERTSQARLERETGVPVVYLPHAYDPERHKPRIVGEEYQTSVFFWGTLWPQRAKLIDSLRGIRDTKLGGIWPYATNEAEATMQAFSVIDNKDMPLWYSGADIALNHHRQFCTVDDGGEVYLERGQAESLGPRAYEIAACGAFQLCDDTRAELGDVFGDSVATYADADDLRVKVEYYLEHDRERQEMAQESRERVRGCTFADRAREIVAPALESIRRTR